MANIDQIQHQLRIRRQQLHDLDGQRALIIAQLYQLEEQLRTAALALKEELLKDFNRGDLERSAFGRVETE